ncbi:unnamed protein product [Brachionus calyciflorus]|uniref:Uncharacterized protein n=1 Tax=Brachionus calyciflorus TaxID=104777 RepID=A0A813SGG1_9BILA|nr:unnamed protein product [Brachionus calyciflorus]
MSLSISYDSDSQAKVLENEIRKLKMELLKQELDDKLLTLKTYLENKKLNETLATTAEALTDTEDTDRTYLGNVLFAKVAGNIQVWQLVLIVLFAWLLLCYIRRFAIYKRNQYKKELLIKLKRQENAKKNIDLNNSLISEKKLETRNHNQMLYSNPSFYDNMDSNNMPFRREFLLYSINENEQVTNKSFNIIRNKKSNNLASAANLSKSDPNLTGLKR